MEVLKNNAYLLRLKRLRHNDRLLIFVSLIDVRTNAELTVSALSVPTALRALADRLDPDGALLPQRGARLPALPRRRNRRMHMGVRSRIRAGSFLAALGRFGRTLASHPITQQKGVPDEALPQPAQKQQPACPNRHTRRLEHAPRQR